MTLAEKALQIAVSQLGQQEVPRGSNKGPMVTQYLKSVGINQPAAWCMAFVYWCHQQAADAMGVKNPMFKTGGVLYQLRMRPDYKRASPQPGDVFIMNYGKGLGHTGIVERVGDGVIYTIEGNTNDEGSREGFEVCRRTRPTAKIAAYLRFS